MKAINTNDKTIRSLDLSTECPKRRAGNPCSYCYVEAARRKGFRAKAVCDRIPYNNEILRMPNGMIEALNSTGGLRLFSFGDYMDWMDEDLERVFIDATTRGLKLKAITKVPALIEKFHDHFTVMHISIDNVGDGVNHEVAKKLRQEYSNVRVRCAIMKDEDIEALSWADIFTFNHAQNGYKMYSKKAIADFAEILPGKVCCITGKCITCEVKCGVQDESI